MAVLMRTGKTRRRDMTRDHIQHVLDTVFNQGPAVLITAALTGIGRATALAFAREGARIVVSGGHDEKGNALVAELQAIGAEAAFIKSDDRHDDEVRALVDETVKQLGRLDVAVNNASTEGNLGPSTDQTAESYAAIVDTNVLSTLLSMHPGFLNFATKFLRNSPNFATLSQRKSKSPHRERRPPRGGPFPPAQDV